MKVAVSIPDPVFSEAEGLARRLNASRSEIYARALDAFVATTLPSVDKGTVTVTVPRGSNRGR